jgi:hypothetical protein
VKGVGGCLVVQQELVTAVKSGGVFIFASAKMVSQIHAKLEVAAFVGVQKECDGGCVLAHMGILLWGSQFERCHGGNLGGGSCRRRIVELTVV